MESIKDPDQETCILGREPRWAGYKLPIHGALVMLALTAACSDEAGEAVASRVEALVGDALPNLTAAQAAAFADGRDAFIEVETLADGLGPVFNEKSCGRCHSVGAVGGSGTQFEVRAGRLVGTTFDSLTSRGGQLFDLFSVANLTGAERHAIPSCTLPKNGEPVPPAANVVAKRRTTALFGLGFVDATPDTTFLALAAAQAPAIRGQVNMVVNISANQTTVGKFGWKAQIPTLF